MDITEDIPTSQINWEAISAVSSIIVNVLLLLVAVASCIAAFRSARSAKESTEFVRLQQKKQEKEYAVMSAIFKGRLVREANYIQAAVFGQSVKLNVTALQNARAISEPSFYELSQFLNQEQANIVTEIWDLFDQYYSKHFFDNESGAFTAEYHRIINPTGVRDASREVGQKIKELIEKL